ncbi:iron chelate uptake ABC transporter family permease subunit [Halocynthiibacter sp. C4]|uniref:iron chelate uptake ABC transporter family permease subunit n=1 Tax=Halocynthiibacter sp. C4 TaxID=2992758 RepID=UPI00237C3E3F|nr:iron chelate uptake ABC transporter family permease subunit [Halocynthiibacter sp. C4]MDE0591455.1 iron chelate uptake ABC transporter family permease subunit [Halocynthiibacter sp. C4]
MDNLSLPSRLAVLATLAVFALLAFMTLESRGNWGFVLPFRGIKALALVTFATSVALSTMVFQTLTANRILTPSIMGFDALYILIQTSLVFTIGGVGYASIDPVMKFTVESVFMTAAALALFGMVLRGVHDIGRMVLTGLILGVLFRSISSLINRLIDPSEFSIIQQASFASFNAVNVELTWITFVLTAACFVWLMSIHKRLDIMALGRDAAKGLGVDYERETKKLLAVIALLVSSSTALIGPVYFYGLLVAALSHKLIGTWRHQYLLPASCIIGAGLLIASQTLFERVLSLQTSVAVVIEAIGGITFLLLLFTRKTR